MEGFWYLEDQRDFFKKNFILQKERERRPQCKRETLIGSD